MYRTIYALDANYIASAGVVGLGTLPQFLARTIPSSFVHYSERGGAAGSCDHLFVEVSCGGIVTYQLIQGRSQIRSRIFRAARILVVDAEYAERGSDAE